MREKKMRERNEWRREGGDEAMIGYINIILTHLTAIFGSFERETEKGLRKLFRGLLQPLGPGTERWRGRGRGREGEGEGEGEREREREREREKERNIF